MANIMNGVSRQLQASTSPWIVVLAFTLLVAPFALQFHLHYPDEMYYTDAAIRMMQNGDYLTTYLGSGELRFKKPILTYWTALAGFQLFGTSPFASRIFFLLAGSALVFLVYQIGKLASGNRKLAYMASWIAATHPVVIFSSTRSIPDILLALFMALSALGTTGLLKYGNKAPKKYLWIFYLGIGLAFEVKGLPAAALGIIAIGYLLFNPWQRISWKKIFYIPAILVCLGIGLFWFGAMYVKFGTAYLDSFFEDQVGIRVGSKLTLVTKNFLAAVALMLLLFFPWIIPVLKKFRHKLREISTADKAFLGFVLVWVVSIILMSAMVSKFYERYLLPVTPLAAVGMAWLILRRESSLSGRIFQIIIYFFLFINLLLLLAGLFLQVGLGTNGWTYLGMALGLLLLLQLLNFNLSQRLPMVTMGLSILALFYLGSFVTQAISLPDQGTQIANFAETKKLPKGTQVAFIGHLHTGSKIRIGLGTGFQMIDLPKTNFEDKVENYQYIICDEAAKKTLNTDQYKVESASLNWDPKLIPDLLKSILQGKMEETLQVVGKRYYWVERK